MNNKPEHRVKTAAQIKIHCLSSLDTMHKSMIKLRQLQPTNYVKKNREVNEKLDKALAALDDAYSCISDLFDVVDADEYAE